MKVRDIRNPGWFWAQNELFDVFQPLIGVHGVAVYMAMCRLLGDPKSNGRLSLRDIARASGASKSQVARARDQMAVLGMIAAKVTGTTVSSAFELLDLRAAAEVGPEELQRRLTLSETRELPSETVPELKAGTVTTVPPRDSFERNRQYSRGSPERPTVPPRDSLAVPGKALSLPGDSFAAQSELFNTETNTERENTRAQSDEQILDLPALAELIVLEHPRTKLRNWTPQDVPPADTRAVIEAAQAEAQLVAGSMEAAAIGILEKIRLIAREVPRAQWRFLKEVEPFMRLREYRTAPAELYRNDGRAPTKPEAALGMSKPSIAKPRDEAFSAAAAIVYWRTLRERKSPRYAAECPSWIRRQLDQEANHNPAA